VEYVLGGCCPNSDETDCCLDCGKRFVGNLEKWLRRKSGDHPETGKNEFGSIEAVKESGFEGFVTISELKQSQCARVPKECGVYMALRPDMSPPEFLRTSTGGHFHGNDPTVTVSKLENKWIENAAVLYIGETGRSHDRTLKTRIGEFMEFGHGAAIGHWGGRYIWQLKNSGDLLICWKRTGKEAPKAVEDGLLRRFEAIYQRLPFANLRH
jgi:hypothetical protein